MRCGLGVVGAATRREGHTEWNYGSDGARHGTPDSGTAFLAVKQSCMQAK